LVRLACCCFLKTLKTLILSPSTTKSISSASFSRSLRASLTELLAFCASALRTERPVVPNRIRKSVGAENTFARDLTSLDDMRAELGPLVEKVWDYCETTGVRGRTVTLKVKFSDFQIITRSRSRPEPISDRGTLLSISAELLAGQFPMRKGVRLIGVSLSSLCADPTKLDTQMTLTL
jgi:DNA polymerase IV